MSFSLYNEAIVHAIFQPLKVDDQTVVDILAEIDRDKPLKVARDTVLSGKVAETKKYQSMVRHPMLFGERADISLQLTLFEHISTYNHQDAPLVDKDYGRHVHRTWVDTHSQSIRTDPEVYLPGEVDKKTDAGDPDSDPDDNNGDDGENVDDPAEVFPGMKRKATTRTQSSFPTKVAKTETHAGASTGVIDDRRPDLTLVDVPVGENLLPHPYGRHGCLFMEVKAPANKKPNPQQVVSRLFLKVAYYSKLLSG